MPMILEISLRPWLSGPIAFRPVAYDNVMAGKTSGRKATHLIESEKQKSRTRGWAKTNLFWGSLQWHVRSHIILSSCSSLSHNTMKASVTNNGVRLLIGQMFPKSYHLASKPSISKPLCDGLDFNHNNRHRS